MLNFSGISHLNIINRIYRLFCSRAVQVVLKICSISTVTVTAIIAFVYFHADVKTVIILIAFLLLYVLLPGCFIVQHLGLDSLYYSSNLSRGFFSGFALNIVIYYLSALTGFWMMLSVIPPALSLLYFLELGKQGFLSATSRRLSGLRCAPASAYIFFACVFLASMFATGYSYIPPSFSAYSTIKLDFGFHAGIINALAAGFPPQNPWIDNFIFSYHYFSEMLLSIPTRLFGLTSENILLMGTPYLITPALSVSVYAFFREFSSRVEKGLDDLSGLYCLSFHFSNMFILKDENNSWFLYHIYSNINNSGLGLACMLTALPLLKTLDIVPDKVSVVALNRERHDKSNLYKSMALFAILVMLMTGIKGPVALTLIGGMVGALLLSLMLRQANRFQIYLTLVSILSFMIVYYFVLGTDHDNATGKRLINLGEVSDIFYLKSSIIKFVSTHGMPHIMSWALLLVALGFLLVSAFAVPFVVGYIREFILIITRRKSLAFSRVVIYACWMVGFLALMILDFDGHSQVYFGFVSCILTPIIAFWLLEDFSTNRSLVARLVRVSFSLCLIFFAITTLLFAHTSTARSYAIYESRNDNVNKYKNVSAEEYEGLIWLRDNTERDILIASDRYYSVSLRDYDFSRRSHNNHFAYGIYSQRRHYLEGSGFSMGAGDEELRYEMIQKNNRLYDPDNEARGGEAREIGVDYVVVSKRFNDVGSLDNQDYELCFSNKHMDIYKISS